MDNMHPIMAAALAPFAPKAKAQPDAELLDLLRQARKHISTCLQALIESETNPVTGLVDEPAAILLIESDQDFLNQIDAALAKHGGAA